MTTTTARLSVVTFASAFCPVCRQRTRLDAAGHLDAHAVPAQPVTKAVCWASGRAPDLTDLDWLPVPDDEEAPSIP
jgi:hypothetical protein